MLDGLPRRLGKYTLVRRLATGGMAELFVAIQKSVAGFEKLIVIKRILPSMNADAGFVAMLLHEARIAATLSHPNIVQVFDLGSIDGAYFIAMEHVDGEDLRAIVRQMKHRHASEFPMEHALSIVLGVCAGLAYAHEKCGLDGRALHIVHRDVSPQNVLVTYSGGIKLVDFGIAKSDARPGDATGSGRLKGKVPYMSPEQARGEAVDARSDVFALGVILYELTTGRRLFKAATEYETLKLICDKDYPAPANVRLGYPPALEAIVMKALAKKPEDRWASARDLQGALEEFVRRERIAASPLALSQFMRALFAEKLAAHSESLQSDKRLADGIDADTLHGEGERASAPPGADASGRPSSVGPAAASRTLTDLPAIGRARFGVTGFMVGALATVGAVAALGVLGGAALAQRPAAGAAAWAVMVRAAVVGGEASGAPREASTSPSPSTTRSTTTTTSTERR